MYRKTSPIFLGIFSRVENQAIEALSLADGRFSTYFELAIKVFTDLLLLAR